MSDTDKWSASLGDGINREWPFRGTRLEPRKKAEGGGVPGREDGVSEAAELSVYWLLSRNKQRPTWLQGRGRYGGKVRSAGRDGRQPGSGGP